MNPEFETFSGRFFQDIDAEVSNEDEMYAFVLSPFKGEERVRLRTFLDAITRDSVSDAELQTLWRSSPADVVFHDSAYLRAMLRGARDRL